MAQKIEEDAIRAKAYELWQLKGCPDGSAAMDWDQAERLLREEGSSPPMSVETAPVSAEAPAASSKRREEEATLPTGIPPEVLATARANSAPPSSSSKKAEAATKGRRGRRK